MGAHKADHPLVGVKFEPEQFAAGFRRAKSTRSPSRFHQFSSYSPMVSGLDLRAAACLGGVVPGKPVVLMAVVGGDAHDVAFAVEAIPVCEDGGLAVED